MDRNNDVMSAEAMVLHAALDRDVDDVEERLGRLLKGELVALWDALELVRTALAEESSRRLRDYYLREKRP